MLLATYVSWISYLVGNGGWNHLVVFKTFKLLKLCWLSKRVIPLFWLASYNYMARDEKIFLHALEAS